MSQYTSSSRPATIQELAELARDDPWDDRTNLKHFLRTAEKYRKEGKELARQGDVEAAFVYLAKAATLVLDKLPTHREYHNLLNSDQQRNLSLVCELIWKCCYSNGISGRRMERIFWIS